MRQLSAIALLASTTAACNTIAPCPCGSNSPTGTPPTITAPTDAPIRTTSNIPTDADRYPYNHAASIVALSDGTLLVAWGAGTAELADDTQIVLARREPGATAWTGPTVVADKPGKADANPVLFVAPDGAVWLLHVEMYGASFCEGLVLAKTSNDGGRTWSHDRLLLNTTCVMIRNRPIVLKSGRWLLPAYVQGVYASQFWASDDAGATWRSGDPLLTFPDNNLQPAVAERTDGSLYALARRAGPGGFTWEGGSTDCGRTWSLSPRDDLPNPNSGLDLIRLSTGEFVAAYNDSPTERTPLVVAWSGDEGRTWSTPRVIDAQPGQASYPSLVEGPDGTVHLVFSDRLKAIAHVAMNRAWIRAGRGD